MNVQRSRFWHDGMTFVVATAVLLSTGCSILDTGSGVPPESTAAPTQQTLQAPTGPPTTAPPSWEETLAMLKPGVARISVTGCDFGAVGSGFQVDDTHVATAAHVVNGAAGITVAVNGQVVTATIVGMNDDEDMALLETTVPINGHHFTFAGQDPAEGAAVGVLGYPQGENYTTAQGHINGLDRQNGIVFNGVGHIIETDVTINGGISGGPLVTLDGSVVGVVRSTRSGVVDNGEVYKQTFQGTNYVNSGAFAGKLVASWLNAPVPVPLEGCNDIGLATKNQIMVKVDTPDERGIQVAQSLLIHGQAINSGAYEMAYRVFTPEAQADQGGYSHWSQDMGSSYWHAIDVADIRSTGFGIITANVSLKTTQFPAESINGMQGCSVWHMQYTLVWASIWWEISQATATAPVEPC